MAEMCALTLHHQPNTWAQTLAVLIMRYYIRTKTTRWLTFIARADASEMQAECPQQQLLLHRQPPPFIRSTRAKLHLGHRNGASRERCPANNLKSMLLWS
jgi:hypothetical protein